MTDGLVFMMVRMIVARLVIFMSAAFSCFLVLPCEASASPIAAEASGRLHLVTFFDRCIEETASMPAFLEEPLFVGCTQATPTRGLGQYGPGVWVIEAGMIPIDIDGDEMSRVTGARLSASLFILAAGFLLMSLSYLVRSANRVGRESVLSPGKSLPATEPADFAALDGVPQESFDVLPSRGPQPAVSFTAADG
ncbi:MAG TPA: hypothetical protein PLS81_03435 [Deltaproteobacteria bacterium]|nr:hypothetical protein [Deltaproteobacteria bacterium]HOM28493.1 hypothetical protein [Deltaproteobacteria bacterium]HPP80653.1 hypothetical protein [Deltaproteobacteria bacterium]